VKALDAQRGDLLGHGLVHLALDPHKGLVLHRQALAQVGQRHLQQFGELAQLGVGAVHVFGDRPDALRHHTGGEDEAVAVQHAAAVGRQLQRAGEAHLTLALEEVVAEHLHIRGTPGQTRKRHRQRSDDELAAPHRRLAGQQRAGAVVDAAAHLKGASAGTDGSNTVTYCVTPGVTGRICSWRVASCCTRAGVA